MTLAQAQTNLERWEGILAKVSEVQSYSVGGRTWTRADKEEITGWIDYWRREVAREKRKRVIPLYRVSPE